MPLPTEGRSRAADPLAGRLAALTRLGFQPAPEPVETMIEPLGRDGFRVESRRAAMGTLVTVSAIDGSSDRAEDATGRAFEEMDRLIGILNRYDRASALSVLNTQGRLEGPPPELTAVVSGALACHRLSGGAFDPTVAPLVNLLQSCFEGSPAREPRAEELDEARARIGAAGIVTARSQLRFARDGMALTLDGIAKGYIVDRMAATLVEAGVVRYLVEAGGDIRTGGRKEAGLPWAVAVRDPAGEGRIPGALHLADAAVATAGSYEHRYDAADRFHHIVEPATGTSPHDCVSATVVAPTATAADALATTVLVLGARRGVALVRRLPDCLCLVIRSDGRVVHSHRSKESSP